MNYDQLRSIVDEHVDLIKVDAKSLSQARELSTKFLVVFSYLANFLRDIDTQKAKMVSLEEATYARAVQNADGKNVTEKKINSALDDEYNTSREQRAQLDALRDWTKNMMKIFENAHVTYRQYSRD